MFVLFGVVVCVVVVRLTDQLLWIKFVCLAVESQQVKGGISMILYQRDQQDV